MKLCLSALVALVSVLVHAAEPARPAVPPAPAAPSAQVLSQATPDSAKPDTLLLSAKYTNTLTLLPGADDGAIAKTFGRLLERSHYTRHKFDDEMSQRFFDRYLERLDPQRVYLLQSDYDEFASLRDQLDDLTLRQGDTTPGYDMFNRFLKRFDQSYAFVMQQLKTNEFSFAGDDKFLLDRKTAPRPANLAAAQQLWLDRLRSEYLAEKLGAGDRQEILQKFTDKIAATNWIQLTHYLTNKFSPEKSEELTKFARQQYEEVLATLKEQPPVVEAVVRKVDERLTADTREEIVKKLTRRYNRTMRNLKQFESDEVLQFWLDALGHAYDPHTDYMGKSEIDRFSIGMNLSLFGIGATLTSEDGYTVIRSLVPGAPADKSKLIKVNDKVVAVAQGEGEFVDVMDEKLNKVVEQIRGPKGTKVRLLVVPAGADPSVRKVIALVRDEVKLEDSEAKAKLVEIVQDGRTNRVGVIDLPSFYANFPVNGRRGSGKSTTGDVAKLLKKLLAEGAEGIVLDLRRNGGGSLEESINLTGLFIKPGPVVQVRNYDGTKQVDESSDEPIYEGPLVVLTSRFSASASEILAGALQDHDRAVIVGDNATHGKGSVQTVQELGAILGRTVENPGNAKITIRKFYRPSGSSTQLKGVTPDVILPSVENNMEVGEGSLDNAMVWDTISPAPFIKAGRVAAHVPELTKRSTDRIGKDQDFGYVNQDITRYRKALAEKMVSLNETVRRAEIAEGKSLLEARKKELAARKEAQPKTWDITLKNSDLPGLPAPATNKVFAVVGKSGEAHAAGEAKPELKTGAGEDEEAGDESAASPQFDPHLKEAGRIVLDLLQLGGPRKGVASRAN